MFNIAQNFKISQDFIETLIIMRYIHFAGNITNM